MTNDTTLAAVTGTVLGLTMRHGQTAVRTAIAACEAGVATPLQQKIVAQIVKAAIEG